MDKNYWENFYRRQSEEFKPSLFAQYIINNISADHLSLLELGCGNGRDAIYFANNKLNVYAVDQCDEVINFLKQRYRQLSNIEFECTDFTNLSTTKEFDIIYSRFTLHSITKTQEKRVLPWIFEHLNPDGIFCIEVRGTKNEIFKLGEAVKSEENAYIYDNHYRRFIDFDELCAELRELGFSIEFAAEDKNFAPFNNKNETFIRIIAKKHNN